MHTHSLTKRVNGNEKKKTLRNNERKKLNVEQCEKNNNTNRTGA